jgi:hypothetical protein
MKPSKPAEFDVEVNGLVDLAHQLGARAVSGASDGRACAGR